MNTFAKVAVAAVVVIAVALGLSLLRPPSSSNVGGQPTVSPSPSPSASFGPSPSISVASPPPLTETFTSERHGFSISYPTGWETQAATEPWTTAFPNFGSPSGDFMYDPRLQDHLFVVVASQPLGEKSGAQWMDDLLAGLGAAGDCAPPIEPVTIDGTQGQLCDATAATSAGDRGYVIVLYTSGDDPAAVAGYDQSYFNDILATLQLRPEDAIDTAPSASP